MHKELGLSNPLSDNWFLKSLLTGIKRIKGNGIKQKLPITLNILRGIFYLLNMNYSYDATFWAVCLVMFFGLFRKSHLLPLSDTKFDSNKQFSRSSFKFYYWGILLTVKWSKLFNLGSVVFRFRYLVFQVLFFARFPASSMLYLSLVEPQLIRMPFPILISLIVIGGA